EDDEGSGAPDQLLHLRDDGARVAGVLHRFQRDVGDLAGRVVGSDGSLLTGDGGRRVRALKVDGHDLGSLEMDDGAEHVRLLQVRTGTWSNASASQRPMRMKTTKPIRASASVKAMPRNIVVRTMPAASGWRALCLTGLSTASATLTPS